MLTTLIPQDFADSFALLLIFSQVVGMLIVAFKTIGGERRIRTRWVIVTGLSFVLYLVGYCLVVLLHPLPVMWKINMVGPVIGGLYYLENKLSGATWHDAEPGGVVYGEQQKGVWPPPPSCSP